MSLWTLWLIVAGVLLLAEMFTLTFYLLWLSLGALAAFVVALLAPEAFVFQVSAGILTALGLTIFSKPLTRRIRSTPGYKDVIDELVGREGIVVEDITPGRNGIVRVGNETWSATSPTPIAAGEPVIVLKRSTTLLEVKKQGE